MRAAARGRPSAPRRPATGDLGGCVGREDVEAVVGRLEALLALAELAVGEDRAVVRRVAHVGVDLAGLVDALRLRPRTAGIAWVASGSAVGRGLVAEQPVAGLGELGRHLVERRRGDDEDAEEGEQREQRHHDVLRAEQVEQQARDDVADRAAGAAQVAGVAEHGLRVALGDLDDAEDAEGERGPADDLAAGGAVVLGVAHGAPPDVEERERDEEADLADRALDHGAGGVHDRAGQLPPDGGGDDDGDAEEEQADAVAAVLGLEVAGGVPDAAGDRADAVGDRQPDRGDPAEDQREEARDRTRAVAHGARGGTLRSRLALARGPLDRLLRGRLAPRTGTPGSGASRH